MNVLGLLMGPMGTVIGMGDGRPDNSTSDMQALQKAYAEARAKRLAARQGSFGSPGAAPQAAPAPAQSAPAQMPWWANAQSPAPSQGFPAMPQQTPTAPAPAPAAPPQASPVPLPQARPAAAPQSQPDTSFFMRNALMQHDPGTGQLIDPQGASQVRGPDLINKMMAYLHNKATA